MFAQSDQRRYFVPCPQCEEFQTLQWKNLKWPEGEPELAYFMCEKNGCVISHSKKRWMVERGEWRPTAQGSPRHVGFHIWAAYSYSPNASWGALAAEFLEAKNDAESLKTFVNTVLGELWEEEYSAKLGADTVQSRAETYDPTVVPLRALVLTCGVDVQDNRFAVSIYAWGRDEETWVHSHMEIYGDPARPEIWKQLDTVILGKYRHESGAEIPISATAVDSGHFTHEVYAYCRERRGQRVIAVKGQSQRGKPAIGKPSKQDVNFRGQSLKWGIDLYPVGSDTIKATLYGRLKHNQPGPGFIHVHGALDEEFFKQLTSEKQVVRYVKGFPVREWVKKAGARNEALDCFVYAYAALQYLYTRHNRNLIWQQFERLLKIEEPVSREIAPGGSPDSTANAENNTADHEKKTDADNAKLQNELRRRTININRRGRGFVSGY